MSVAPIAKGITSIVWTVMENYNVIASITFYHYFCVIDLKKITWKLYSCMPNSIQQIELSAIIF